MEQCCKRAGRGAKLRYLVDLTARIFVNANIRATTSVFGRFAKRLFSGETHVGCDGCLFFFFPPYSHRPWSHPSGSAAFGMRFQHDSDQ
ncbi:hypothetical protein D8666_15525 [Ochrobactrum soli]|nr:hypothetical protein D8666_15525 [[Ochrobactrum] soli]